MKKSLSCLALISLFGGVCAVAAEPPLKLIDAHSHLLRPEAEAEKSLALFKEAGLAGVVIMDPEPADLRAFAERHSGFVIPFVSVSRTPATQGLKFDATTADQMRSLLDSGAACGIGELPTRLVPPSDPTDAATLRNPDRLKVYELASQRRVPLNAHIDLVSPELVDSLERVLGSHPSMPLVLAHAGWSAGPELIGKLLDAHPNLQVDMSVRLDPANGWANAPAQANQPASVSILQADGSFQPAWRALIERHADRFLFAMDISTGAGGRTGHVLELAQLGRKALAGLSRRTQEAVAHGNIEKLLSQCRVMPK